MLPKKVENSSTVRGIIMVEHIVSFMCEAGMQICVDSVLSTQALSSDLTMMLSVCSAPPLTGREDWS